MNGDRLRIIVLGYIVRGPLGGLAWHHLQYVMGLAHLGYDVYFVEDSDDYPACYDPVRNTVDADPTYGLDFTRRTFHRLGIGERWAYYDAHTSRWLGPRAHDMTSICAGADLLLSVSGVNPLRPWVLQIPRRALIDTDPVFTQIRHLTDPAALEMALQHTSFFSFGENIGTEGCSVPDDGLPWRATRQPIVLDAWEISPPPPTGKFTTIMQWDSYPAREYDGRHYGMKSESFWQFINLPQHVGPIFEIALGSASAPRDVLEAKGWTIRNPLQPTRTPWTYQEFLRQSRAEFGVAKHGYVASRSGWFSERSAAYLASGRPVVVQDTGFSRWLDVEAGVLPFNTYDEAVMRIENVNSRYETHCTAARAVAEQYFDAYSVLPFLIDRAMSSSPTERAEPCPTG